MSRRNSEHCLAWILKRAMCMTRKTREVTHDLQVMHMRPPLLPKALNMMVRLQYNRLDHDYVGSLNNSV